MQRQVQLNRVPRRLPVRFQRISGRLRCRTKASSSRFRASSGEGLGGFDAERAHAGSSGFWKVPEKLLVQGQVKFNGVPEKVRDKVWEALVQSQVSFNWFPKIVPEKVLGFGARAKTSPEKVLGWFGEPC